MQCKNRELGDPRVASGETTAIRLVATMKYRVGELFE